MEEGSGPTYRRRRTPSSRTREDGRHPLNPSLDSSLPQGVASKWFTRGGAKRGGLASNAASNSSDATGALTSGNLTNKTQPSVLTPLRRRVVTVNVRYRFNMSGRSASSSSSSTSSTSGAVEPSAPAANAGSSTGSVAAWLLKPRWGAMKMGQAQAGSSSSSGSPKALDLKDWKDKVRGAGEGSGTRVKLGTGVRDLDLGRVGGWADKCRD